MDGNMRIPLSFAPTAESYQEARGKPRMDLVQMPRALLNPQTTLLCERLGIDDPLSLLLGNKQRTAASPRVNQVMSPTISESELNITMETSKLSTNPDEVCFYPGSECLLFAFH